MQQQSLDFNTLQLGAKITARPDGTVRGGTILEINSDGSVKAEFYCPRRQVVELEEDEFVLSENWNEERF